jgi:hypothetical protein
MASGNTLLVLTPPDCNPPATLYATLDWVVGTSTPAENIPVLDFDDTTVEYADFYCVMPSHYSAATGVTLTFVWSAAANSNNGVWAAAFRLVGDDVEDLDTTAHTYDYNTTADLTPPSAVGEVAYDTLTFTAGADMDSVVAGSYFVLRVRRPAPSGTKITGDCSLHAIIITDT